MSYSSTNKISAENLVHVEERVWADVFRRPGRYWLDVCWSFETWAHICFAAGHWGALLAVRVFTQGPSWSHQLGAHVGHINFEPWISNVSDTFVRIHGPQSSVLYVCPFSTGLWHIWKLLYAKLQRSWLWSGSMFFHIQSSMAMYDYNMQVLSGMANIASPTTFNWYLKTWSCWLSLLFRMALSCPPSWTVNKTTQ